MPTTPGWFVVNVRDAAWVSGGHFGDACVFEGDAVPFGQVGYTLAVLRPGQPSALYHREADQEDFLVLAGECLLLVEEQERRLRAWDFVHCPPDTEHIFVGAGDAPCVIFMAGARTRGARQRLRPLGARAAPRRGRGARDAGLRRGVRAVRPLAPGCAGELVRAALGAAVGSPRRMTARILTSLVGSYAQPDWLIDRERLRERFPPRVRARELWRVDPAYLEEAQDDATRLAVARPGAGRPGHRHGRRDAPRELLEPLRHRARGRRRRQPGHGARPQRPPQPGAPGRRARRAAPRPCRSATCSSCARTRAAAIEDHGARAVHDVAAGPERLLRIDARARAGLRGRRARGDPRPLRGRRRRRPARRALHAGAARGRRASTASRRSTARSDGHRGDDGASTSASATPRSSTSGPSGYSFLPELAATQLRPDLDRDRAVRASTLDGPGRAAGQDDHPRRPRPLDGRTVETPETVAGADPPRVPAHGAGAARSPRPTAG